MAKNKRIARLLAPFNVDMIPLKKDLVTKGTWKHTYSDGENWRTAPWYATNVKITEAALEIRHIQQEGTFRKHQVNVLLILTRIPRFKVTQLHTFDRKPQ
jgi:hypothetical protein